MASLSAKQVAAQAGITPKVFRRKVRALVKSGDVTLDHKKGERYEFTPDEAKALVALTRKEDS